MLRICLASILIFLTASFSIAKEEIPPNIVGGKPVEITNGRINGDRLSFTAGLSQYSGRVSGNRIEGAVSGAASGTWSATLHSDNPVSSPQNH